MLRAKRQIQSQRMTQLSQLPRRCALAQHLLDGIARHDMDHQKNERENEPEGRQGKEKSFEEWRSICRERLMSSPAIASRLWPVAILLPEGLASCFHFQPDEHAESSPAQRAFRPFPQRRNGSCRIQSFRLPWV